MKTVGKKLLSVILTILMTVSSLSVTFINAYAFDEQTAEKLILSAWKTHTTTVDMRDIGLSAKDFSTSFMPFYASLCGRYPEYFYVVGALNATISGGYVTSVELTYDGKYTDAMIKAFNEKADSVAASVSGLTDPVDKALYFHEYLMENMKYDYTGIYRTAYDALMNGTGVCESYSKAFSLLMHKAGLECRTVDSAQNDHEWNMVGIGGKWYYVDITWDDTAGWVHSNFLTSGSKCTANGHLDSANDWTDDRGENVTGRYNYTDFDSAFWTDARNIMTLHNGIWYYTDGQTICAGSRSGSIRLADTSDTKWYLYGSTSSYYVGGFADAVICGGMLYYSLPNEIHCITTDGKNDRTVYTLTSAEKAKGSIYDLSVKDNKVIYSIDKEPLSTTGKAPEYSGEFTAYEIHVHTLSEWTTVTEATCVREGERERHCTGKGCTYSEKETVPVTGHRFGTAQTLQEPTCDTAGLSMAVCSVCGKTEVSVIAPDGHSYSDWEVTREPTCEKTGSRTRICSVCGKKMIDAIPKTEHQMTGWKVTDEPFCDHEGIEYRECSVCGISETRTLEMTEHEFGEWQVTAESTCIKEGVHVRRCRNCGEFERENLPLAEHQVEVWINAGNAESFLGGMFNPEYIKGYPVATCYSEGREHGKCTVCGKDVDRTIPRLEHNYVTDVIKAPTCTQPGTGRKHCTNDFCYDQMMMVTLPPTGHECSQWTIITEATCTTNGLKQSYCEHCNNRVEEIIPAAGHTFSEWETVRNADCTGTGLQRKICTVCGETATEIIPAAEHDFGEWTPIREATCTEYGYDSCTCSVCGETKLREIEFKGHSFGEWKVTLEPTSDKEGLCERVCAVCGERESKPVPKIEDGFAVGDVNADGRITTNDAKLILRFIAKIELPTDRQKQLADFNNDGRVTTNDAKQILRKIAGLT